MTATMISPTFCSRSSMDFTLSQVNFFSLRSRTSPSRLLRARNSSNEPRPKTRHTCREETIQRANRGRDEFHRVVYAEGVDGVVNHPLHAHGEEQTAEDERGDDAEERRVAAKSGATKTYSNFSLGPTVFRASGARARRCRARRRTSRPETFAIVEARSCHRPRSRRRMRSRRETLRRMRCGRPVGAERSSRITEAHTARRGARSTRDARGVRDDARRRTRVRTRTRGRRERRGKGRDLPRHARGDLSQRHVAGSEKPFVQI